MAKKNTNILHLAMSEEAFFHRLCHIFPAVGLRDLKVECAGFGTSECAVRFVQDESHHPHPVNGFYCRDKDSTRFTANMEAVAAVLGKQPIVGAIHAVKLQAFLSVANHNRADLEAQGSGACEFERIHRLYGYCIRLSRHASAVKTLEMIESDRSSIVFCLSDGDPSGLIPVATRLIVAEAFAGLAMVALRRNKYHQMVGFATASVDAHASALPFINCIRLVACARRDTEAVVQITELVLLPFFIRSCNTDLYDKEINMWDPSRRETVSHIPQFLVSTSQSMASQLVGQDGVMKAKLIGGAFVEKLCKACRKGFRGEKLFRCSGCGLVYYCSKACQVGDWKSHKAGGCGK
jgi:hypothetical protein